MSAAHWAEVQQCKCGVAAQVLRRFGELRLQVTGASMLPSLWPGDILIIRSAQLSEIFPGDIVLLYREDRFSMHRVVRVAGSTLQTRGDSMYSDDPVAAEDDLLGRVVAICRGADVRPPVVPGPVGRMVGVAASRSTMFSDFLLKVHTIRNKLRRAFPAPALVNTEGA